MNTMELLFEKIKYLWIFVKFDGFCFMRVELKGLFLSNYLIFHFTMEFIYHKSDGFLSFFIKKF